MSSCYHLGGLRNRNVPSRSSGGEGVGRVVSSQGREGEAGPALACGTWLAISGNPRPNLCLHLPMAFSLCVSVSQFPFHKVTRVVLDQGPTLFIFTNDIHKASDSKSGHTDNFHVWSRGFQSVLLHSHQLPFPANNWVLSLLSKRLYLLKTKLFLEAGSLAAGCGICS